MDKRYEQAEDLEEKHKRQLGDSLGTEEKTFVLYISESGRRPGDYARVESGQAESLCRFFWGNQTYVTSSSIFRGADSSWVFAFALSRSVRAELLSWLFSISVWLSSSLLVLALAECDSKRQFPSSGLLYTPVHLKCGYPSVRHSQILLNS